jgi:hypothetical protein
MASRAAPYEQDGGWDHFLHSFAEVQKNREAVWQVSPASRDSELASWQVHCWRNAQARVRLLLMNKMVVGVSFSVFSPEYRRTGKPFGKLATASR